MNIARRAMAAPTATVVPSSGAPPPARGLRVLGCPPLGGSAKAIETVRFDPLTVTDPEAGVGTYSVPFDVAFPTVKLYVPFGR